MLLFFLVCFVINDFVFSDLWEETDRSAPIPASGFQKPKKVKTPSRDLRESHLSPRTKKERQKERERIEKEEKRDREKREAERRKIRNPTKKIKTDKKSEVKPKRGG